MKTLLITLSTSFVFLASAFAGDGRIRRSYQPIPNQYLVLLKRTIPAPEIAPLAARLASLHGGRLRRVMTATANGFSVEMSEAQAKALSLNPEVVFVEEMASLACQSRHLQDLCFGI